MSEQKPTSSSILTGEEMLLLKHMQKTLAEEYKRASGLVSANRKLLENRDELPRELVGALMSMTTAAATSATGYAAVTDLLAKTRLER